MILHLFWIIPAILFLLSHFIEPRHLFNAYLLVGTLFNFALVAAGLTIVSIERWVGTRPALTVFMLLFLTVPICVLFSTAYMIFNGSQMMAFEGRRLANLLSLLYGIGTIFLIGLNLLPSLSIFNFLLTAADFLFVYVTFLYISYVLYGFWCNLFPIRKEPRYIIILGSGLIGDKVPPLLAQRLDKGLKIYEQFQARPKIIVSGGQGADESISEAKAMKNYLLQKGLSEKDILLEDQSRTTFENLTFSQNLMTDKKSPTVVVTNSFHALRAGIYMRKIGLKGSSVGSRTALYFLPSAWIRETVGLISFYWKWHLAFLFLLLLPWLLSVIVTFFFAP